MKRLLDKLLERWDLDDPWQILPILLIFSISGMSVLFIRKWSFSWLGFGTKTPLWMQGIAWILIIVPSYQLLLLIYGFILGQFEFFWRFEMNNLQRLKELFEKIDSFL